MERSTFSADSRRFFRPIAAIAMLALAAIAASAPKVVLADEGGVSFWLPGFFGSLAAAPATPGWSLGSIYYHTSVSAGGNVAAAREIRIGRFTPNVNINLNLNLNAQADLLLLAPTYTFATPVLGGQFAVSMMGIYGRNNVELNGALTLGAAGRVLANRMG